MDLYAVLNLAPGASPAEIKAAYHRALLAAHPDKNNASQSTPDIAAIKDTYRVFSSPALRTKAKADQDPLRRLLPAQIISLVDFDEHGADAWTHVCRCGSAYAITGAEMDRGVHLVPCTSYSEVIWVSYELVEEE
jgi:diphthamide biosynthesis protein 4